MNGILRLFVEELKYLEQSPLIIDGIEYRVVFHSFVADDPGLLLSAFLFNFSHAEGYRADRARFSSRLWLMLVPVQSCSRYWV